MEKTGRDFTASALLAALAASASLALLCSCGGGSRQEVVAAKEVQASKSLPAAELPASLPAKAALPAPSFELSDSLGLSEGRSAGQSLGGLKFEKGSGNWIVDGQISFRQDGSVSSPKDGGGSAFHQVPRCSGIYRAAAEMSSTGSSCAGLAFFSENPAGRFFKSEASIVVSGGSYEVATKGMGKVKTGSKADYPAGKEGDALLLELVYDSTRAILTAKINGKAVLDSFALKPETAASSLSFSGFRLNGPLKPGVPWARSYSFSSTPLASSGLAPADLSELFIEPGKEASIAFKAESPLPGEPLAFVVKDYQGKEFMKGSAEAGPSGEFALKLKLPRGYYDLEFPASRESFGVVSLERPEKADPFFCMDSAMTWLETDPARRAALIKILKRCGISMSRERLGVGHVNRGKGSFDWSGGKRGFEDIRKLYSENGVELLEMLDCGARPADLPDTASSLAELARHWGSNWGGAEVSNEPDLRPFPGDHYAAEIKTMSYALAEAKSKTPLVSGVFASIPPGPFFETCAANGFFSDSDAVSFHSYDKAPDVESMVARYREWMGKNGCEAMPLWHSECGWSWTNGPARPPVDQDALSALEISAKAMESLACGVARHFPFVYVYYEEGHKNFGMMGREASPLRSMGAYAACVGTLAGRKYIGDLQGLGASAKLARVFQDPSSGDCVAAVYTGEIAPDASVAFPFHADAVFGADGRSLPLLDGKLAIPDGLSYASLKASSIGSSLNANTRAMKLFQTGQRPESKPRRASPLVLQFLSKETPSRASTRNYLLSQETAKALPVKVRAHNLSKEPVKASPELRLPGGVSFKAEPAEIPAMGFADFFWKLDASKSLDIASTRMITVVAEASCEAQPTPLAVPVVMEGSFEQHLAKHAVKKPLPIEELGNWTANVAGHGKSKFSVGPDGWRMDVSFSAAADNWVYPKFKMPFQIDPAKDSGFLIRARISKAAGTVAIMANPNQPDGFWATDLFPADGEWHVAYVPFGELKPGPGHAGMQNTRLNPAAWHTIAIGMGSRANENSLEISHFMIVGGSGEE